MAQLLKESYPLPDLSFDGGDWRQSEHEQAMSRLMAEKTVVKFPVADSFAYYIVVSMEPLKLQHVPYSDAWHANPALIRGLRKEDVKRIIARQKDGWKF